MSDSTANSPRPVALITIAFVFALAAIGLGVVSYYYKAAPSAPQNAQAENLPKDLAWRATPADRRKALNDLREKQSDLATRYGWVDQKAGTVRLPISRAMELTAAQYGSKK